MGCASSKPYLSNFRRTNFLPPQSERKRSSGYGDGLHIVSLSSSTLGTIKLDSDSNNDQMQKSLSDVRFEDGGCCEDFSSTWSDMIEQKMPKRTPSIPSAEPDAVINVWELMEGLEEDISTIHRDEEDNEVHRKSENEEPTIFLKRSNHSLVKERIQAFQEKIDEKKEAMAKKTIDDVPLPPPEETCKCPPGGKDRVVVYLTSLRGIRKTYEDCYEVQMILKGYRVRIDERDVSMDSGFKKELIDILGPGFGGSSLSLPRVFAAGRYLGSIDEVRETHEKDKLGRILENCKSISVSKSGRISGPCKICDDVRFIPCETCSGSRKVYVKEEFGEDQITDEGGQFRRCPDCNENGLVRCPACCDVQP